MALQFLKRDFPELDTEPFEMRHTRRITIMLYTLTHGLWLISSATALVLAITDALPASGQVLLVGQILE